MSEQSLSNTIAYCGLVCGVCVHAAVEREGCPGCRQGGGDKQCFQRSCCQASGLQGCWECDEFPCQHGYFADAAWRGICIASAEYVRDCGPEAFVERLVSKVGTRMEIGDYRHKEPHEIRAWLRTTQGKA